MGQIPAKYMPPSAPYGGSQASNSLTSAQPTAVNPQTPLLPPNFTDPGKTMQGASAALNPQFPKKPVHFPDFPMKSFFGL